MKKTYIFFFWGTLFLVACKSKSTRLVEFDNLFELQNTINISEQSEVQLQGVYYPTIYDGKVFLPSSTTNDIYLCDTNGILIGSFNKGYALNLRSPTEIIKHGDYYFINDKGNHQVKKLNNDFQIESTLNIDGQVDKILSPIKRGDIIIHGTQRHNNKEVVLFKKFNHSNREIAAFGSPNPKTVFHTWNTDIDEEGNIYMINVSENLLEIYSPTGKLSNKIRLKSSSIDSLLDTKKLVDKSPMEVLQLLENKSYYSINNINVYKGYILVQFQHSLYMDRFLLDIYNKQGEIIHSSIIMSERILSIEHNNLATFTRKSKPISSIDIKTYKVNL